MTYLQAEPDPEGLCDYVEFIDIVYMDYATLTTAQVSVCMYVCVYVCMLVLVHAD